MLAGEAWPKKNFVVRKTEIKLMLGNHRIKISARARIYTLILANSISVVGWSDGVIESDIADIAFRICYYQISRSLHLILNCDKSMNIA